MTSTPTFEKRRPTTSCNLYTMSTMMSHPPHLVEGSEASRETHVVRGRCRESLPWRSTGKLWELTQARSHFISTAKRLRLSSEVRAQRTGSVGRGVMSSFWLTISGWGTNLLRLHSTLKFFLHVVFSGYANFDSNKKVDNIADVQK